MNRLNCSGDATAQADKRRKHRRYAIGVGAELTLVNQDSSSDTYCDTPSDTSGETLSIQIRNISKGGVEFTLPVLLEVSTVFQVVPIVRRQRLEPFFIDVRHCRWQGDGQFAVGGQICMNLDLMCQMGVEQGELADAPGDQGDADHPKNDGHQPRIHLATSDDAE